MRPIEAGIAAGRPHRVRVTHFAEQVSQARAASPRGAGTGRAGRGRGRVRSRAREAVRGGRRRRRPGQVDRRPSTGELLVAVRSRGAAEVVVVPNDRDVVPAAEAAARLAENEHGIRVAVIPTRPGAGLAALAVHDPGRAFEQDLVEMTAAARHAGRAR